MSHAGKHLTAAEILNDDSYDRLLKEEGRFWGETTQAAMTFGIPPWVDIQRSQDFHRPVPGAWDDQMMHKILFGDALSYILREATRTVPAHVLDLGCGAGWLSLELARSGLHVRGVDISEGQIAMARDYGAGQAGAAGFGSLRYEVADLSRIVLEAEQYDVITAWGSLHHISDLDHLLHQVSRALKPQGVFLVYDDIDWARINHLWLGLGYLLIPGHEPIGQRLKKLFRRFTHGEQVILSASERKRLPRDTAEDSPFEMVHGADIIGLTEKHFQVMHLQTSVTMSLPLFFQIAKGRDCWVQRHRYGTLRVLKRIENALIRLGLAEGSMALIKAVKKDSANNV